MFTIFFLIIFENIGIFASARSDADKLIDLINKTWQLI